MNASVAIQVLPKVLEQEETRRIVDEVISYLEGKLETACGTDEVKQQLLDLGYEPAYVGSEELAAISVETSEQLEHWVTLIS